MWYKRPYCKVLQNEQKASWAWPWWRNPLQVDELIDSDDSASSSSDSESDSYLKKINVLTKDQEIFLELVKHISDPNLQKEYLNFLGFWMKNVLYHACW